MLGTAAWLVLLGGLGTLELIGLISRRPIGPSSLVGRLSASIPGRILVVTIWVAFGWHLFTRYTPVR